MAGSSVEHDQSATGQAARVVAMTGGARAVAGVGGFIGSRQELNFGHWKTFFTVMLDWLALAVPTALLADVGDAG